MTTVLAAFLAFAVPSAALARTEEYAGVHRVDLHVSAGNVTVNGTDRAVTTLSVTKKRYDERCRLTVEQKGDLLRIDLGTRNLFKARCEADFDLMVPKSVALKFKSGSGNVRVNGTTGAVAVETGTGHVDVKAKILAFDARVGSGSVRAEGLEAPASVETGTGNVRLVYDRVPADGQLEIRSGSGDAEVLFPKHARVHTLFTSGTGSLQNRLGDSPNARFTISMKAGTGDLRVGDF
jgi:DUF4097 and DUF4098 domain-containing protein YvlB